MTAANVADVAVTSELLHGSEETVYGDSGYLGAGKREDALVRNNQGKDAAFSNTELTSTYSFYMIKNY